MIALSSSDDSIEWEDQIAPDSEDETRLRIGTVFTKDGWSHPDGKSDRSERERRERKMQIQAEGSGSGGKRNSGLAAEEGMRVREGTPEGGKKRRSGGGKGGDRRDRRSGAGGRKSGGDGIF
jgi:hypothetical protein